MNPNGGHGLYKVPGLDMTSRLGAGSSKPLMGGARMHPSGIASKFIIKQEPVDVAMTTPVDLYLCQTGRGTVANRNSGDSKEKTSIEVLNQAYQTLTKKTIKGSLSSFIASIPGNFESQDSSGGGHDSTLRSLIDRPPIGGREFLPISEQLLLGFRLHPGSLPEQYQLDPPSIETSKPHKKKKKHKHKYGDKLEETTLDNYSPSLSREHSPPVDPCDFIKAEQTNTFFPTHSQPHPSSSFQTMSTMPHLVTPSHHGPTIIHAATSGGFPLVVTSPAGNQLLNFTSQPSVIMGGGGAKFPSHTHSSITGVSSSAGAVVGGGETVLGYQMSSGQVIIGGPGSAGTNPLNRMIPQTKQKKVHKRHDTGDGSGGIPKKKKKDKKEKRKKKHHLEQPLITTSSGNVISSLSTSSTAHVAPPPLVHSNYPPRPP